MVEEQADNSTHRPMTVMLYFHVSTVLTAFMVEEQADNSTHRTMTVMLLLSRLYSSHSTHGGRASRQLDS